MAGRVRCPARLSCTCSHTAAPNRTAAQTNPPMTKKPGMGGTGTLRFEKGSR
ncbi:Uncharacterised protein [Mycobacteroides abscessus subsp. abscessus]|nr:Uncharacterised protein [Mycobacteroides abscessus subsp. abscessus]